MRGRGIPPQVPIDLHVKDVLTLLRTTFPGANQRVQRLVDAKILNEIAGQAHHRRFQYGAYVSLFDDEARHD
jgi:hypothetical protein